jgi:hypothetical protein
MGNITNRNMLVIKSTSNSLGRIQLFYLLQMSLELIELLYRFSGMWIFDQGR